MEELSTDIIKCLRNHQGINVLALIRLLFIELLHTPSEIFQLVRSKKLMKNVQQHWLYSSKYKYFYITCNLINAVKYTKDIRALKINHLHYNLRLNINSSGRFKVIDVVITS